MLMLKDANASVSFLIIEIITVHYNQFHHEALAKEFLPLLLKVINKYPPSVDNWILPHFSDITRLLLHLKTPTETSGKPLKDFLVV